MRLILSLALVAAPVAAAQDVPLLDSREATLAQMSKDVTAEIADCGTTAAFVMPPKKKSLDDAKGVIDAAATPEQVACAKGRVSWLLSDAEARARGVVK
jgi:hypothetical protein